jgi:DNA recombination protein RmuC
MATALYFIAFLIGVALGGGLIWFYYRVQVESARQHERHLALADRRVAEELAKANGVRIQELEQALQCKDDLIAQRDEQNTQLHREKAVLYTMLQKEREKIQEKIDLLKVAEQQFKDTFEALAARALDDNTKKFDQLYSVPVKKTLEDIKSKITLVDSTAMNLGAETSKLVRALQKPEVRGQWGEMHLRRVVEIAGMMDRCDFDEQHVLAGECQLRPDLVVHYPGDRHLAVDAKAPIRAFLEAADATDDELRKVKLREFVQHVRDHIKSLSSKAYYEHLNNSTEFVVLFLPSEAVFTAALSLDAELSEFAAKHRVHLAGPCVLITLLRAVALGWKQESLASHAKEICQLGEELYKRLAIFGGHLGRVGKALNNSVSAYNDAVGSLELRVMPQARRFEQIGATPADAVLEELLPIGTAARALQCADFLPLDGTDQPALAESLPRPR